MLNKKEIINLSIILIILAISISALKSLEIFLYSLLSIFLIVSINIAAKKIAASSFESEIETRIWGIKRYGFKEHKELKNPFLAGAIFPLVSIILFQGTLAWMASLVFDVKPKISRASKKQGLYSFSEITEWHIGLIAIAGIFANLFFALLAYLIGMPPKMNFSFLSIWFVFFNMIPISDLDGNKIFFANFVLWSGLAITILTLAILSLTTI
jgi:Zn-dependent protease